MGLDVVSNAQQSLPSARNLRGHALAGTDPVSDALASAINEALQGGPKGSKERADRTEFFSDVLSMSGQKFVASPKGKDAISRAVFGIVLPLALVGFVAGYYFGKRKA